jgi:hypothetical protein
MPQFVPEPRPSGKPKFPYRYLGPGLGSEQFVGLTFLATACRVNLQGFDRLQLFPRERVSLFGAGAIRPARARMRQHSFAIQPDGGTLPPVRRGTNRIVKRPCLLKGESNLIVRSRS